MKKMLFVIKNLLINILGNHPCVDTFLKNRLEAQKLKDIL